MALAFRAATIQAVNGLSTTCTLTPPAGLADNDILLIMLDRAQASDTITWPSGFVQLHDTGYSGGSLAAAWKRASGESGNYVPAWGTNSRSTGICYAISGADQASTPVVAGTVATGTGTAPAPPSVDPGSSADRLSVVGYGQEGTTNGRFTPPTTPSPGYTEPSNSDGGTTGLPPAANHCGLGAAYRTYTGQTETPGTATSTVSGDWAANTYIFHPPVTGRIMGTLAGDAGLAGAGGLAGIRGGLAG